MNDMNKFHVGLIINPISGMGGSVGLKGTDGAKILQKAINLGAQPNAASRTEQVFKELSSIESKIVFHTPPGPMGGNVLNKFGFAYEVVDDIFFKDIKGMYDTTPAHTIKAATLLKSDERIRLLLFVGGDGTARDILNAVDQELPCLGIPAGVKIYSSVFAVNPSIAATIILQFLWDEAGLRESEVLDIDEEAYREGKLVSRLYGHLLVPFNPDYSQRSKMGTPDSDLNNQERIAKRIIENLKPDTYYFLGPGTTTKAVADLLNVEKSILGIDLLLNKEIIGMDLNESQILKFLEGDEHKIKGAEIIVSPIGRQGFLFGRGNLQFSPKILWKIGTEHIIIVATKFKMDHIPNNTLRLDTRDPELDDEMRGLYKVLVDYDQIFIVEAK